MKVLLILLGWFALLAGLDVALTMHILANGGVELNPLALPFLAYGYLGLAAQKAMALIVVGALMYTGMKYAAKHNAAPLAGRAYVTALTPIAAFPVAWNLGVIV